MKRLLLILTIASVTLCQTVHAQYYSVNYDKRYRCRHGCRIRCWSYGRELL